MLHASRIARCPLHHLIGEYLLRDRERPKSDGWAAQQLQNLLGKQQAYSKQHLEKEIKLLRQSGFHVGKKCLSTIIGKSQNIEDAGALLALFPTTVGMESEVHVAMLQFASKSAHFKRFLNYFETLPRDNKTLLVFVKFLAKNKLHDQVFELIKLQQRTQRNRVTADILAVVISMTSSIQELKSVLEKGHTLRLKGDIITEEVIRSSIKLGDPKCRNLLEWVMEGSFGTPQKIWWLDPVPDHIETKTNTDIVLDSILLSITTSIPKRVCTSSVAWGGYMYYNVIVGYPKESIKIWKRHLSCYKPCELPLPAATYIIKSFGLIISTSRNQVGGSAIKECINIINNLASYHRSLSMLCGVAIRGKYQRTNVDRKTTDLAKDADKVLGVL